MPACNGRLPVRSSLIHQRNNSVGVAMGVCVMAGEPLTPARPAGLAVILGRLRGGVALHGRAAVRLGATDRLLQTIENLFPLLLVLSLGDEILGAKLFEFRQLCRYVLGWRTRGCAGGWRRGYRG